VTKNPNPNHGSQFPVITTLVQLPLFQFDHKLGISSNTFEDNLEYTVTKQDIALVNT